MQNTQATAPPPYEDTKTAEPYRSPYPPQNNGYTPTAPASTVVMMQPQRTVNVVEAPSDYLVLSIVGFLFCCLLGIIALVKSIRSRDESRQGYYEQAARSGRMARNFAISAIVAGIVIIIISIVRYVMVLNSLKKNSYNYN